MSRIVIENVPDVLKKKFTMLCGAQSKTMRDVILGFIEKEVEKVVRTDNGYRLIIPHAYIGDDESVEEEKKYTWDDLEDDIKSTIKDCVKEYNRLETTTDKAVTKKSQLLISDDPLLSDGKDDFDIEGITVVLLGTAKDEFLTTGAQIEGEWYFLGNTTEGGTKQALKDLITNKAN